MLRLTLTLLALAALTACGPRPKAYGPIPDEARALEVAREILGDQVDQRSLKVSSERGAWIVRAATTVGTATLRLDLSILS